MFGELTERQFSPRPAVPLGRTAAGGTGSRCSCFSNRKARKRFLFCPTMPRSPFPVPSQTATPLALFALSAMSPKWPSPGTGPVAGTAWTGCVAGLSLSPLLAGYAGRCGKAAGPGRASPGALLGSAPGWGGAVRGRARGREFAVLSAATVAGVSEGLCCCFVSRRDAGSSTRR